MHACVSRIGIVLYEISILQRNMLDDIPCHQDTKNNLYANHASALQGYADQDTVDWLQNEPNLAIVSEGNTVSG
jgi:hypothetical protein